MTTDTYMTSESTSKVHDHWPVKYAVANVEPPLGVILEQGASPI